MKIYLASRYSRREELLGYKSFLEDKGHTVNSRWLLGTHQLDNRGTPIGDTGEALVEGGSECEAAHMLRQKFLSEDLEDVTNAEWVISFTEQPRAPLVGRGGRHVEFGYVLGLNYAWRQHNPTRLTVVGYRENLFHWHPSVEFYYNWDDFVSRHAWEKV